MSKSKKDYKYELAQVKEHEGDHILTTATTAQLEYKVYARRWLILFLFIIFGIISTMSWIQYSIITNIIIRYYNVSAFAVDWTSLIFMLVYIPLIFPGSYLLDKKGLRFCTLLGVFGTCLGSWIKVFSVPRDRFVVTFVGHTIVGMSQVFLLSVPPRLAAVWFGAHEVSTACALGVFGIQFGVAMGFLSPPLLVKNHPNIEDVGSDLSFFYYLVAGGTTVVLILVLVFFKDAPPLPPSAAQALKNETKHESFFTSIKRLVRNRGYVLHIIAYGINLGVYNGVCTMLNQLVLVYFPDGEEFAGRVGLMIVVSGMCGSIAGGVVLDKTHKYKETTVALFLMGALSMLVFSYTLVYQSTVIVYITSLILGFFLGGYMSVGFELAVELTYPEPEGNVSGLLMFICQLESFFFTYAYSCLMSSVGDKWSNSILCVTLLVGTALTAVIPPQMRRQEAVRTKTCLDLVTN